MLPVALSSTMLIPSNGATLSGTALLDASASGPVVGVDFRLTGGSYSNTLIGAARSTQYGWIYNWDTSGICGGSYSLAARAFDGSGNSAYSPSISVSIGGSEPVSTNLLIPADGAAVSGTTTVDASATGPLKGIDFRATGNGYSNVLLGAASATPWGWLYNWNTMDEPNGTYTLTSHVVDCAGNSIDSAPITVTVANVATPYVAPPSPVVRLFGDSIFSQTATYFDFFYGLRGYAVAHHEWALPHRHRSRTGTEHIGDLPHPANIGEQIRGGRIMAARGERLRGGSDGTSAGIALRLPERVRI
jgi:hypothetical protein